MASQGPNSPSAVASVGVGVDWTTPTNATSENGSSATAAIDLQTTDLLAPTTFGFSIPGGSTINGIVLEVKKKSDQTGMVVDDTVSLTKDGTSAVGSNKADAVTQWPSALAYVSYGASNDLWGTTWSVAEINASAFGALVSATEQNVGADVASIDHVRITVHYTAAGVASAARASIGGENLLALFHMDGII